MCLRSFTAISAADHREFTTWRAYAVNLPCRNTADGADLMRNQRSVGLLAATMASFVVSACSEPSPPTTPTVLTVATAAPQPTGRSASGPTGSYALTLAASPSCAVVKDTVSGA